MTTRRGVFLLRPDAQVDPRVRRAIDAGAVDYLRDDETFWIRVHDPSISERFVRLDLVAVGDVTHACRTCGSYDGVHGLTGLCTGCHRRRSEMDRMNGNYCGICGATRTDCCC